MAEAIPPKLGQFISQNVESVAQLEALLLLKREAGRALPVSEVAKVLYLAPAVCSEQLSGLVTRGILASESAASGELAAGFRWNADWTHTEVDDEPLAGFSPVLRSAAFGATTPENRGNVALGWTGGPWTADAFVTLVGDHQAYALYAVGANPRLVDIDAYAAIGGRVARTFEGDVTVALSGQNLGDSRQRQSAGLEVERRLYLSVSKRF